MSGKDENAGKQSDDASKKLRSGAAEELARLKFEKKNQSMARLPRNLTVQRRPLIHAPVASPFAGASVQKVVYVSRNTPIMSAVKRVKKLLFHIEKRAMQAVDLTKDHRKGMRKLVEANEKLGKNGEPVLVKASGRAMEQALRVAEWFRHREDELSCRVEVRTGSVQAVDDIVSTEDGEDENEDSSLPQVVESADNDESTMIWERSLLSSHPEHETSVIQDATQPSDVRQITTNEVGQETAVDVDAAKNPSDGKKGRRRRGKRKRKILEEDDDIEARIRWVKTVEVSISLRC